MSNEQDLILATLVATLEADTTLMALLNGGIQPEVVAGSQASSPFVRIDYLEGSDLYVIGLTRVWLDSTWHIRGCSHWRGIGQPDRTEVNAIGDRLDQLLHKHEEIVAGLQLHSFREEPTPFPALTENGDLWLQSGGIYRVRGSAI